MNNKLKINTAAGILDIIGSVLYLIAPFALVDNAIGEAVGGAEEGSTSGLATVFMIFAIATLIVHIVAFVKSKKVAISNVGNTLGIIGHALYVLLGIFMAIPALVLSILAAIFTLRQKNLN